MTTEKVNLTGARETLLMTLYGKALESRLPHSLLKDHFADEAVRRIDYDFSRLKVDGNLGIGFAIRAKTLDVHVEDFVARNPDAIVLHLGCGLDTRVLRVNLPRDVDWFDVDYPEVIELRRKLYPSPAFNYPQVRRCRRGRARDGYGGLARAESAVILSMAPNHSRGADDQAGDARGGWRGLGRSPSQNMGGRGDRGGSTS